METYETLYLQKVKLLNKALKTFSNSPKQLEIRKQIDIINNKMKGI